MPEGRDPGSQVAGHRPRAPDPLDPARDHDAAGDDSEERAGAKCRDDGNPRPRAVRPARGAPPARGAEGPDSARVGQPRAREPAAGVCFCSRIGTPWDETNFARHWERVRRRGAAEGVRPLRFHAACHSWATWALRAGKSVRWVAQQLGHQDPAFTLRVYAHAMREEEKDLSFAEFGGSGRPHTASAANGDPDEATQPLVFTGGPPGTRTQNQRVKSPLL